MAGLNVFRELRPDISKTARYDNFPVHVRNALSVKPALILNVMHNHARRVAVTSFRAGFWRRQEPTRAPPYISVSY